MQDAIIFPLGGYVPIKDVECVDESQHIWKGRIVDHPNKAFQTEWVYFSREYLPAVNELDQIYKEKTFDDKINGVPFLLVPKEKLLFGYFPPSIIHMPNPAMIGKQRRPFQ